METISFVKENCRLSPQSSGAKLGIKTGFVVHGDTKGVKPTTIKIFNNL